MALNASQQEFHDLAKQKDDMLQEITALQQEYDNLRQAQQDLARKLQPVKERLKAARAPIYDIDVRRAQIARSLQGQTGKPE